MITFKNLEEMKPYYVKESNTHVIDDDITIEFDLSITSNIRAWAIRAWNIDALNITALNINAGNINAWDINAWDINAFDIKAKQISYYAVCCAYHNINCSKIEGRRQNSKHFCLDGKITIEEEGKEK